MKQAIADRLAQFWPYNWFQTWQFATHSFSCLLAWVTGLSKLAQKSKSGAVLVSIDFNCNYDSFIAWNWETTILLVNRLLLMKMDGKLKNFQQKCQVYSQHKVSITIKIYVPRVQLEAFKYTLVTAGR